MRRIAVLSTAVLVGGLLGPSSALATGDEPADRWLAVEDQFAGVLPDGQTFTEDAPPPGAEEGPIAPPVGTRVFVSETLYATEDGTTRGEEIGRTHIECTAGVVPAAFRCDIAFVLANGSQLHGAVHVDFSAQSETEPLRFDIAVTGGTDDFAGAAGEVSLLDVTPAGDPAAETLTLYEVDLT